MMNLQNLFTNQVTFLKKWDHHSKERTKMQYSKAFISTDISLEEWLTSCITHLTFLWFLIKLCKRSFCIKHDISQFKWIFVLDTLLRSIGKALPGQVRVVMLRFNFSCCHDATFALYQSNFRCATCSSA